ncbi:MAG: hypothetical protein RMJ60_04120 [Anaerolineales bacterium]|nr:hypothetical protein [Anaerolineales bacterium]
MAERVPPVVANSPKRDLLLESNLRSNERARMEMILSTPTRLPQTFVLAHLGPIRKYERAWDS